MNGNNIRVGNLFGIPFYINPSWFLVLALVTLSYGGQLALFPQLNGITPWVLGLFAALLLFASVLAHELGHSFVAQAQGIEVKSITLFLFGGVASLEKDSKNPLDAFLVAIAGPVVSLILFAIFTFIGLNFPLPAPLMAIVSLLGTINLVLALFNLIPGLPLDGGNVLKAAVWQITGNPNKGIIFASRVGQAFGWLAVFVGILGILNITAYGSFWTLLIGWFLLQNAGVAAQSATVQEKLDGLTAADAIIPNSPVVSAELTLREFVNEYVIGKSQWQKFLVTDETGELLGTLLIDDLKKVPTSDWIRIQVKDVMQSKYNVKTIAADLSLLEVIKLLEQEDAQQLTVVRDGIVLGLLEKASIINLLQQQAESKLA